MPSVGIGTASFQDSDPTSAVVEFLQTGGRLIDAAASYDVHTHVKAAISISKIPRDELFLQTKVISVWGSLVSVSSFELSSASAPTSRCGSKRLPGGSS